MMKYLIVFSLFIFGSFMACNSSQTSTAEKQAEETTMAPKATPVAMTGDPIKKIVKTEAEWKAALTAEEYHILREAGTERAFTGDLLNNKKKGVYTCAACQLELFSSDTKFKSGTGWPSYYQPIAKEHLEEKTDTKHGWDRTEVLCGRCDGHLGHVFKDGPKPTGLRYCINSVSLNFVEQ